MWKKKVTLLLRHSFFIVDRVIILRKKEFIMATTVICLGILCLILGWGTGFVRVLFQSKEQSRSQEHRDLIAVGKYTLDSLNASLRYEESLSKREQQANRELKALAQEKLLAKKALSAHADLLTDDEKQKLQNFIEG